VIGTRVAVAVASTCAVLVAASMARAQDPPEVRCDTVLTQAEAVAIVGDGYQGPAVDEPRPGFSRCEWQGSDSNFGFTFASLKALAVDATTADKAFDIDLQAVEDATKKRELLPGIAVNAATVDLGEGAALLEVQRADGVARMIVYKLDRDKMLALAKAIATP
jgi:hypothetical protein